MEIGDRIVHVQHGVGRIVGRQTRTIDGQEFNYLEIEVAKTNAGAGDLTVLVAEDEAGSQLRAVASEQEARAALAALVDDEESPLVGTDSWRAQLAAAEAALGENDLVAQARVLRDLEREDMEDGLSGTLKRVRDRALRQVGGEIAVALDWDRAESQERLIGIIHGDIDVDAA